MTPSIFGDYLLVSRLVERSMAEVFFAVRLGDRTGRLVVLKRPPLDEPPSGEIAESLRREIEVLGHGPIEGLVRMIDHGEMAGLPFIVVEHAPGRTLDALIARGPLEPEVALALGRGLASSLAALHARGWVHGDVSPANVVAGEGGEVTLLDLGIASRAGHRRETPAGKPGYAAPEAALGKPASFEDDVYGWGVVVAEAVLGARLFRETQLAEAGARAARVPPALERLPIVARALSLDPSLRPAARAIMESLPFDPEATRRLAERVIGADLAKPHAPSDPGRPAHVTAMSIPPEGRAAHARPEHPAPAKPSVRRAVLVAIGLLLFASALGIGVLIGRRSVAERPRPPKEATLTLPPLPARAEVKLDGRTQLSPSPSRQIPIEPGSHRLTIQLSKREPREFEFVAEPGDNVVVVVAYGPKSGSQSSTTKSNLTDPD